MCDLISKHALVATIIGTRNPKSPDGAFIDDTTYANARPDGMSYGNLSNDVRCNCASQYLYVKLSGIEFSD